ncbi:MAG: glycosyltransferase [Nocardioidaceae bacterium]
MTQVLTVYAMLRSAHLERLQARSGQRLLYVRPYPDLDEALLAAAGDRVQRVGLLGAAAAVISPRGPLLLEVNEPLMLPAWPLLLVLRVALGVRRLLRRGDTRCVAYAIENLSPADALAARTGLPTTVSARAAALVCGVLVRGLDGLVFGTRGAQDVYARTAPGPVAALDTQLVTPLSAPCGCRERHAKTPCSLLFVGELSERKGLPLLLEALELVPRDVAVTLVGSGPLLEDVERWAAGRPGVRVLTGASREQVHDELSAAQVLVLVSQTSRAWREQVGLPIVEGLAHGCTVVASDATGVADDLRTRGHLVLDSGCPPESLAAALVEALAHPLPVEQVLASLPAEDGRAQADELLYAGWR